ncbi:sigma-70 family RNA polymerase sigma factor [Desulfurivibrio alkaliphilus]|uniref:RNA polymerase, sigma 28 subunit, FliA/WhiG subfamily n=1 Tax=Desulfurivibrio alkaliphilus (strain DSM 19089 / UNIQEM U267 / AHT2) TaxID=589865 RepID=D6Z4E2_DESAT|nr:FliA/WhiG family RNA polymerase sigma factor [Desulfurivibrio alkaliphilus]ADH86417.1 RNA polymerase, sigma 28 subunit, FliA/WhiG subfamily [Desulfurivibrio alkaliphilus AHT 2]
MMQKQPGPSKFKDYTSAYFDRREQLDPAKREELILNYTPLIKYIASRLASRLPPQVAVDDLISCGIVGLIDAINKFDPAKNVQFKTYAEFRIKGAMLDELRALDWVPRSIRRKVTELEQVCSELEVKLGRPATDEETATALGIGLEEYHRLLDETKSVSFLDIEYLRRQAPAEVEGNLAEVFASDDKDPFAALNLGETKALLAKAINELPEKEKLTVALYYHEELTMREIGEVLGYTESRISQMHSKAMLRLRGKLKKSLDA